MLKVVFLASFCLLLLLLLLQLPFSLLSAPPPLLPLPALACSNSGIVMRAVARLPRRFIGYMGDRPLGRRFSAKALRLKLLEM